MELVVGVVTVVGFIEVTPDDELIGVDVELPWTGEDVDDKLIVDEVDSFEEVSKVVLEDEKEVEEELLFSTGFVELIVDDVLSVVGVVSVIVLDDVGSVEVVAVVDVTNDEVDELKVPKERILSFIKNKRICRKFMFYS